MAHNNNQMTNQFKTIIQMFKNNRQQITFIKMDS